MLWIPLVLKILTSNSRYRLIAQIKVVETKQVLVVEISKVGLKG